MKKNSRVYAAIHLDALEQNLENMKKKKILHQEPG